MEEMDANQVKALKYLIKASPAGEIQDILTHIGTLVGSVEALTSSPQIVAAIKTWYETHKYHITLPNGNVAMVTAQNCLATGSEENPLDAFVYYDDVQKVSFSFDPISQ